MTNMKYEATFNVSGDWDLELLAGLKNPPAPVYSMIIDSENKVPGGPVRPVYCEPKSGSWVPMIGFRARRRYKKAIEEWEKRRQKWIADGRPDIVMKTQTVFPSVRLALA